MPFNLGHEADTARKQALAHIDTAAGETRSFFVSPGELTDAEYQQTQRAVERWRSNGSPSNDVPSELQSGAKYDGLSIEAEAQKIEQMAAGMELITDAVRTVRLDAKGQVWAAQGEPNEQALIAQATKAADAGYEQIKSNYADYAKAR